MCLKKKFFRSETRSTVSICRPLEITESKIYGGPPSESHCEITGIHGEALLQLARSLRSLARCDCARFARFVTTEAGRQGVLSGLFWRVKKIFEEKISSK